MISFTSSASGNVKYIPGGWVAPGSGYWMEIEDGRDILAAWDIADENAIRWEKAFHEMSSRFDDYAESNNQRLTFLENSFNAERKAWNIAMKQTKHKTFWNTVGNVLIMGAVGAGVYYIQR